jgi:hypothetical protein
MSLNLHEMTPERSKLLMGRAHALVEKVTEVLGRDLRALIPETPEYTNEVMAQTFAAATLGELVKMGLPFPDQILLTMAARTQAEKVIAKNRMFTQATPRERQ